MNGKLEWNVPTFLMFQPEVKLNRSGGGAYPVSTNQDSPFCQISSNRNQHISTSSSLPPLMPCTGSSPCFRRFHQLQGTDFEPCDLVPLPYYPNNSNFMVATAEAYDLDSPRILVSSETQTTEDGVTTSILYHSPHFCSSRPYFSNSHSSPITTDLIRN